MTHATLRTVGITPDIRSVLIMWADWAIGLIGLVGACVALFALRAGNVPLVARSLFLTIVITGIALYASLRQRVTVEGPRAEGRTAGAGDT